MRSAPGRYAGFLALTMTLAICGTAHAVSQLPVEAASHRLDVDVWINKEEGGVYRPGESMRVFFRSNADAYVLVYNIDTEGYIHLVYPYGPTDPLRVEGGRTYRIPARHDPYDLVADGPAGMEFVVAVASPVPLLNLPWYLRGNAPAEDLDREDEDELEAGVIVGDPYVGMERLNRRIISPGAADEADASETYFYIGRRVEYPRYVCADCHYSAFGFDPYLSVCSVIDIRIDATWARYAPIRVRTARPRYYYWVRSGAPSRYRAWKERWSSLDGSQSLRQRFVVERTGKPIRTRELKSRRDLPEFRDLRRTRPGRLWQGRDEVLKVRERRQEDRKRPPANIGPRSPQGRDSDRPRGRGESRDPRRDQDDLRQKGDRGDQGERRGRERDQGDVRRREREPDRGRGRDRGREQEQRNRDRGNSERDRRNDDDRGKSNDAGRDRGNDNRDQSSQSRDDSHGRDRRR